MASCLSTGSLVAPLLPASLHPPNLTQRQRKLIEEFGKEEEGEYGKCAAAGAS
ncbi:hypothetical protein C1H46_029360 [Malus baccata]|uniref:Uncharacterized protein n=1 Tax=Malus baccata TaxID=106549 RepID=A0A540LF19_MALBA|nr:hypothetical protein C1H46_029360 [Malus baccata]